jgi:hypothetical protein
VSARVHVFAGPSLPQGRVSELLPDAIVHGPIAHRSVLELPLRRGDVVAIIDGLFLQSAAVRHKELLHVMEQGIEVWGAASMGALRAAELSPLGMRGVGLVFRLFAHGVLERDDEVAVSHSTAEHDYRPMSDALVSIRVTARRARRLGCIDASLERMLIRKAAALPFHQRLYRAVEREALAAGADPAQCAAFVRFASEQQADVKCQDAERLLRRLAAPRDADARSAQRPRRFPKSRRVARWIADAQREEIDGTRVSELAVLAFCRAFADDYAQLHRRLALRAIGARSSQAAPAQPASAGELEDAALLAARRQGLVLGVDPPRLAPELGAWLTADERRANPRDAAIRALVRSFRSPAGRATDPLALDVLRGTRAFRVAQQHVARCQQFNARLTERDPQHRPDRISSQRVNSWFAGRWGVPATAEAFELALLDRGEPSADRFSGRARAFLPYAVALGAPSLSVTEPDADPSVAKRPEAEPAGVADLVLRR